MKNLLLAIFGIFVFVGCGGEAPIISSVELSQLEVRRSEQFFANMVASDLEGDFNEGLVKIEVSEESESLTLNTEVPVFGIPQGRMETSMSVGLRISGRAPFGEYTVRLMLVDEAGNKSEPVETQVTLTSR